GQEARISRQTVVRWLAILAAAACVGFAVTSFIVSNPVLLVRFKSIFSSQSHGSLSRDCHWDLPPYTLASPSCTELPRGPFPPDSSHALADADRTGTCAHVVHA